MILINLLPPQYRKKQRPPLRMTAAIAVFAALDFSLAAWLSWLHFGEAAKLDTGRELVQETLNNLSGQMAYYTSLQAEIKHYKTREETLQSIVDARVGWTPKVDQLIDVINGGGEGQKYLIWLDDLLVSRQYDKRKNSAGMLRAKAHCGSENLTLIANFMDDLQRSPFIDGFNPPAPPEGSQSEVDASLVPASAWTFPLELALKVAEEPAKAAAKPDANKNVKKAKADNQQ